MQPMIARIHADLDQLEGHPAVHRLLLFGPATPAPCRLPQSDASVERTDSDACVAGVSARSGWGRSDFRQVFGWIGPHADQYTCSCLKTRGEQGLTLATLPSQVLLGRRHGEQLLPDEATNKSQAGLIFDLRGLPPRGSVLVDCSYFLYCDPRYAAHA